MILLSLLAALTTAEIGGLIQEARALLGVRAPIYFTFQSNPDPDVMAWIEPDDSSPDPDDYLIFLPPDTVHRNGRAVMLTIAHEVCHTVWDGAEIRTRRYERLTRKEQDKRHEPVERCAEHTRRMMKWWRYPAEEPR